MQDKTYVQFTEEMKKEMVDQFMLILNNKYLLFICDENEKVVAFGFCIPGIGKAVQKSGGRLTLPTIFRLLRAINNPTSVDLALIGVLPEYRRKGIATAMINKLLERLAEGEVEYAETNLNLEDNVSIQNQWKIFDSVLHKRRRSYIKTL